ncbi:MAG: AgmX/PglI C-terminal domain-containing protein [Myxococcales bacterium]|nr:AgmX/PglI C-terminal domain-containing protein [Myxococcales bacterium]MCB9641699.1 AgmX/PglI C-terminal domain-containing protein [Myxococcales bacterium]
MRSVWRSMPVVSVFCACLGFFGLSLGAQATPPKAKEKKRSVPLEKKQSAPLEKDKRETMILPLRYVDGHRLANMMRLFVPSEERYTEIRYSPALHKILVRARPEVLQILKRASEQMDVPQAQFGVQVFFVKTLQPGESAENPIPRKMDAYLRRVLPTSTGFSLVERLYVHAINHQRAQLKIANLARVSDPSVQITLHQAPSPNSGILVEFLIRQHESFQSTGTRGTNTQFISSVHLSTNLFVRPGVFALVGHTPLKRSGKQREQVLALMKIQRIQEGDSPVVWSRPKEPSITTPAPKVHVPKKRNTVGRGWGRRAISRVIRENRKFFKVCYERALAKQPKLQGRIVVSFSIQGDGRVAGANTKSSTLRHPVVEACILSHFKGLRFPAPPGGRVVRVNYPLLFNYNQ